MPIKNPGLPFSNPVGESLELMKKMWGFAGLPGIPSAGNIASMAARIPQQLPSMLAPTLDVDELEKRIADLRAVEQWLELNASILRTTIQGLEVQRATIATLKGITGAMLGPVLKRAGPTPAPSEVALGLKAMQTDESKAAELHRPPPAGRDPAQKARKRSQRPAPAASTTATANPNLWWNTLQDQFNRIAATAAGQAAPESPAKAAKAASKTRKRRAAKRR